MAATVRASACSSAAVTGTTERVVMADAVLWVLFEGAF